MSYARFGWDNSDVYVYTSSEGIECCGCLLIKRHWVDDPGRAIFGGYLEKDDPDDGMTEVYPSNTAMIEHMTAHRAAGHTVPQEVFDQLADPDDAIKNEKIWSAR